jgi:hypothetical protein
MKALTSCVLLLIDGQSFRRVFGTVEEILEKNLKSYKNIATSTKLTASTKKVITSKSLANTG